MIADGHPYRFVQSLREKQNLVFNLSKYVYKPDSLLDERIAIKVSSDDFTEDWVVSQIGSLGSDQELALHSTVIVGGRTWHIPMIDFAVEDGLSASIIDRLRLFVPKSIYLNMAVFESGRSFHAYSTTLLSPKEWLGFMGRLLLVNPKGKKEIIDSRWIGHRLIGGFCALRWSNNSGMYVGEPTRVKLPI